MDTGSAVVVTDATGGNCFDQLTADGFPAYGLVKNADGTVSLSKLEEHKHCVCGGSTDIGDHTAHQDVDFQPWESATSLPTEGGAYYLTRDVTLSNESNNWRPGDGVKLCLNGHTVTISHVGLEIYNSSVVLTDCQENRGTIRRDTAIATSSTVFGIDVGHTRLGAGNLTMYGGTITGFNTGVSILDGSIRQRLKSTGQLCFRPKAELPCKLEFIQTHDS